MTNYCGNCGTLLVPNANFCANCKAPITDSYTSISTSTGLSEIDRTLPGKNRAQLNMPTPTPPRKYFGLFVGVLSGMVVSLLIIGGIFTFVLPGLQVANAGNMPKGKTTPVLAKNATSIPSLKPTAISSPVPAMSSPTPVMSSPVLVIPSPAPAIPSPVPVQDCGGAFSDIFNSKLHDGWNWVDPSGRSTYQVSPGFLTISTVGSNDLNSATNYNAPRLLQPITGNFTAKTSIDFSQNQPYGFQAAGILIWQDRNNFIRLDKNLNSVDFELEINGIFTHEAPRETPTNITALQAELQLQRTNDSLTASWRLPGEQWKLLNTIPFNFHNAMIGLALIGASGHSTTANYKYFNVSCV